MKRVDAHTLMAAVVALLCLAFVFTPEPAFGHCDALDGPVVKAAQAALESGNANLVLIWVRKEDESKIREAFDQALAVRKLGPEAKQLADLYFFETVVRIHRAGEGAPYTGLKPAGLDLGPAIPAADRALETGSIEPLVELLTEKVKHGLHEHFTHAIATKRFDQSDVDAGRDFVKAYVEYIHFAERVYEATIRQAHGLFPESNGAAIHEDEH